MKTSWRQALAGAVVFSLLLNGAVAAMVSSVQLGPRPFWLVSQMRESTLKDELSK
jgi:hypothetical protein